MKNPQVDHFLLEGCGRCPLGGTPECKVHDWQEVLIALRQIVLTSGLQEERKWGVPCYTHDGANVVLIGAFKNDCTISFLKGSLMKDPDGVLIKAGENSHVARIIRFTSADQVWNLEAILKKYLAEAIAIEKAGLKVEKGPTVKEAIPEEFQRKLEELPALKAAYEALTPGRKRGYLIYFSQAKQSKTRAARVEKYIPKILEGKGFHDR
ncbi:MAG: YdeI/OmpD-associated family protein [Saprospiraceae bacterium]|nr:YdeI/OmpD-associated family protein [Saprospiraceae bacterium]